MNIILKIEPVIVSDRHVDKWLGGGLNKKKCIRTLSSNLFKTYNITKLHIVGCCVHCK